MRPIIALIRLVVFSNIFVAICSASLTHLTYISLKLPKTNSTAVLLLVFCGTYFIYNVQRIVRLNYANLIGKNIGVRLSWIVRNRSILLLTSLISGLISLVVIFYLNVTSMLIVIPLGVLSILYITPFIPVKRKWISLRKLPFAKVFVITIVWTLISVALPFVNEYGFSRLNDVNFQLTLLTRFFFLLAITFPFDIRDLNTDNSMQLKTIPSIIGVKPTVILSELLLLGYWGIKLYQFYYLNQLELAQFIALTISIVVCVVIIAFGLKKRPELYYSGLVESTMVILHIGVLVLEY